MRKLIAAMNMTLDGFCDHTSMNADDELHQHYTGLLNSADAIIYGRITYQLMESYWPTVVKQPTGNKTTDEFAEAIENVSKIVFSNTLKNDGPATIKWKNSRVATRDIMEEILDLKQQPGRDIFVGSPGLIVQTMKLDLVDEYHLCVQPIVIGNGLQLFKNITNRVDLKLLKTKAFSAGSIVLYYKQIRE